MIKSKEEAIAGFQRDLMRWRQELVKLETEGSDKSGIAAIIRTWINEMERLVSDLMNSHN